MKYADHVIQYHRYTSYSDYGTATEECANNSVSSLECFIYATDYSQIDHSQMESRSLHRIDEERFGGKEMPDFVLQVGLK